MKKFTPEFVQPQLPFDEIPYGYCHCGCGEKTAIVKLTNNKRGCIKGKPNLFLYGHHAKVKERRPVEERFWEKVDKRGPNECWEWKGGKNRGGYGQLGITPQEGVGHIESMAHRLSYQLHIGPIPDGLDCLHKCDNPPCVNPDHLFLGTDADNVADKVAKGRQSSNVGIKNPKARLNESQVKQIREMAKRRILQTTIAREFGVSVSLVEKIVRRILWKHI